MRTAAFGVVLGLLALASAAAGGVPGAVPGASARTIAGGLPSVVAGAPITQGFGCTRLALEPVAPACPGGHFHSGVDLAAPVGTPVRAAAPGRVKVVSSAGGYGLHVLTTGLDGALLIYGHLSAVSVVGGSWVEPGEEVGRVGATGNATGPHLHFEVRVNGIPVDPSAWLRGVSTGKEGGHSRWSTR